ncbi:MAG: hypothetical protein IM598_15780 [Chitinophagaceae bacterium]|nr:hypothetical protein [Chitinophagaceae bacterium]MCA6459754.1 hypothetical protein [Chitinophagaceae bacterium]MCA6466287.1 hypothetical protein [Chitinophagaceae bacterium]
MKNWLWQSIKYDLKPTPENFIKFKWCHFVFCRNEDRSISAGLYLTSLLNEIKNELAKHKSVNKKSLTLSVIQNILQNPGTKNEMIILFESAQVSDEAIKAFLNNITTDQTNKEDADLDAGENKAESFHTRTYIIATHLYFEINNDESQYYTLMQDTQAFKKFLKQTFKATNLSGRLSKLKSFSYKHVLKGKNNDGEKGQLKPQFKQIISHPEIFGADVSRRAEEILISDFPES